MDSVNPLSVALTVSRNRGVPDLNEVELIRILNTSDPLVSLDRMHRDVPLQSDFSRSGSVERHNRKTHVLPYNPMIVAFFVVAKMHGPRKNNQLVGLDPNASRRSARTPLYTVLQ